MDVGERDLRRERMVRVIGVSTMDTWGAAGTRLENSIGIEGHVLWERQFHVVFCHF